MQRRFLPFAIFLTLLGGLNYYLGLRGWQWVQTAAPGLSGWTFWLAFALVALAFPVARFAGHRLPPYARHLLMNIGAYWLLILYYGWLLLLLIDIGRVLNAWTGFVPAAMATEVRLVLGAAVLLLLALSLLYGVWRARTPVVVPYEITIPKSGGKHEALHIVFVSDTHLGEINGVGRLRHMIAMVNALQPDLILHGGDLIDDEVGPFLSQKMPDRLKDLKAPLGVYAVLGNHDYPDGASRAYRQILEQAGVHLLVDEGLKVNDSFYLIGRDDVSGARFRGQPRKPLEELLQPVDRSLPVIVIDHQPYRLAEAEQAGVDLQVSGHTHRGQMFPNNYITRRVWELDWGYLTKGPLHVIVSSGFGTWGPPVRIGNRPEVVNIRVRFTGSQP